MNPFKEKLAWIQKNRKRFDRTVTVASIVEPFAHALAAQELPRGLAELLDGILDDNARRQCGFDLGPRGTLTIYAPASQTDLLRRQWYDKIQQAVFGRYGIGRIRFVAGTGGSSTEPATARTDW